MHDSLCVCVCGHLPAAVSGPATVSMGGRVLVTGSVVELEVVGLVEVVAAGRERVVVALGVVDFVGAAVHLPKPQKRSSIDY